MSEISSNISLLLFLGAFPVIIILLLVYYKDKNKEPIGLLMKLFIGGFISCGLVLMLSGLIENYLPVMSPSVPKNIFETLLYSFIGVALIEEISKWIMVYFISYYHKEFDEIYDGLVYSVFVSLGFAFIENILYVLVNNSIATAIVRAICAVPSHACDAIFMGYHISIAKQQSIYKNKRQEKRHLLLSIIMPTLIHGIYDFCLLSGYKSFIIVFLIFVVVMYFISINKLHDMSSTNKKIIGKKYMYCKYCGQVINHAKKCNHCGRNQF